MRVLLAGLALVSAGPAMADKQDKAQNAAAIAAIKARADQLRANPSDRGCLGRDAVTCVATLAQTMNITTDPVWLGGGLKLPKAPDHDINGNVIPQQMEFQVTFGRGERTMIGDREIHVELSLLDGVTVDSVDVSLKESPLLARTATDWDATHVFDIANAVLGESCVGGDRLTFYRKYDAAQRTTSTPDTFGGGYSDPSVASSISGHLEMCGTRVDLISVAGVAVSSGSFGGASMVFRKAR